jgi:hypothetical protein
MRAAVPSLILVILGIYNEPLVAQTNLLAQDKKQIRYDLFNRSKLGDVKISPQQSSQFTPVGFNSIPVANQPVPSNNNSHTLADNSIEEQNRRILQQHNMLPGPQSISQQVGQLTEAKLDLSEEELYRGRREGLNKSANYRMAFNMLNGFNVDNFSITNAVFIVENAFLDNKLSYNEFLNALKLRADLVKQILKREKLDSNNNLALNYGIQKLYTQSNAFYNSKTKKTVNIPPFHYDFNDAWGERDYTQMFTIKLLGTNKGQCHSMPLLYLMIAEQLDAKSWLALAPQHSFIQFTDQNRNLMNFETTNGNIVSYQWLSQSGFINATALKERTYLDTLSQRQLYSQCLADLLLGYLSKFGYDNFAEQIRQKIIQVNPKNMIALIIDADVKRQIALQKIFAAGKPPLDELPKYPEAYHAYLAALNAGEKIDALGYQDMPKEAYQSWLNTVEQEKKKQESRELQEKMQREIERLRNIKQTLVDKSKH